MSLARHRAALPLLLGAGLAACTTVESVGGLSPAENRLPVQWSVSGFTDRFGPPREEARLEDGGRIVLWDYVERSATAIAAGVMTLGLEDDKLPRWRAALYLDPEGRPLCADRSTYSEGFGTSAPVDACDASHYDRILALADAGRLGPGITAHLATHRDAVEGTRQDRRASELDELHRLGDAILAAAEAGGLNRNTALPPVADPELTAVWRRHRSLVEGRAVRCDDERNEAKAQPERLEQNYLAALLGRDPAAARPCATRLASALLSDPTADGDRLDAWLGRSAALAQLDGRPAEALATGLVRLRVLEGRLRSLAGEEIRQGELATYFAETVLTGISTSTSTRRELTRTVTTIRTTYRYGERDGIRAARSRILQADALVEFARLQQRYLELLHDQLAEQRALGIEPSVRALYAFSGTIALQDAAPEGRSSLSVGDAFADAARLAEAAGETEMAAEAWYQAGFLHAQLAGGIERHRLRACEELARALALAPAFERGPAYFPEGREALVRLAKGLRREAGCPDTDSLVGIERQPPAGLP